MNSTVVANSLELVKISVNNYLNSSNTNVFFDLYGNFIRGYTFSRLELKELLGKGNGSYIFAFLGEEKMGDGGKMEFFISQVNNLHIQEKSICQSNKPAITLPISDAPNIKSFKFNINPIGLNNNLFHLLQEKDKNPLLLSGNRKIKGYNFLREQLEFIGVTDELTVENENDEFVFVPVLCDQSEMLDEKHLNFSLVKMKDGVICDRYTNFGVPCPTACNNYSDVLQ